MQSVSLGLIITDWTAMATESVASSAAMIKQLLWLGVLCVSGFVLAGLLSYAFGWGDVGWMALIIPFSAWVIWAYLPPRRDGQE